LSPRFGTLVIYTNIHHKKESKNGYIYPLLSFPCFCQIKGKRGPAVLGQRFTIAKQRQKERIYIPKADLDEIKPSIIPHIHDSMLYKINAGVGFKQKYPLACGPCCP